MHMSTPTANSLSGCKSIWLSTLMMLASLAAFAQQKITGVIRNASNAPLENVSVSVKGSNRGTTTNSKGVYTIPAKEGETLVVSFIGFQTREIKVSKLATINISLADASNELEGVVVTTA